MSGDTARRPAERRRLRPRAFRSAKIPLRPLVRRRQTEPESAASPGGALLRLLLSAPKRHPSAILLLVQLLGIVIYPFIETTAYAHVAFNVFGIAVMGITVTTVRQTPGATWVSASLAIPVVALLLVQIPLKRPELVPVASGLEALVYFHAAGSLIAYMMEDFITSTDELFAAVATFTVLVWAFTHLFMMIQALQPGAFSDSTGAATPRTWSELNHLSFALLSSTGMGSVVAVSPHARAAASIEMMVGVLYLATVVARLIGFTIYAKRD